MVVTRKATMEGYNKNVWFSTRAITNIIALHTLIYQYRVTYDSDNLVFVVHRESESKPNMEFNVHKRRLHYYDPKKEHHLTLHCLGKQGRLYQASNQVCRNRTKPVQDLDLPFHEEFQVGKSGQSNQRLPRDDSRH
jgi:hypothetical protein